MGVFCICGGLGAKRGDTADLSDDGVDAFVFHAAVEEGEVYGDEGEAGFD